jgi:hypothetical protein
MDIIQGLIENKLGLSIVNTNGTFGVAVNTTTATLPTEIVPPSAIPTEISVVGTTTGTIGTTERFISFPYSGTATTKDYSFTTTENLVCDILVVGGGGCGGRSGGGGGTVLYTQNVFYPTGTYSVKVANGGISLKTGGVGNTQGANGNDSDILFGATTIFRAKGGGFGAANYSQSTTGGTGGSGGGSESVGTNGAVSNGNIISTNTSSSTFTILANQSPNGSTIRGNIGGIGAIKMPNYYYYVGGGGGGAGGAGGNGDTTNNKSGAGGSGVNIDIIGSGSPIMYGSGGAGGIYNDFNQGNVPATSGTVTDGGGTGAYATTTQSIFGSIPTAGRGGGGGGWSVNALTNEQIYARDGGSGIVIIRYRKPSSEIVVSSIISGTTDRYISFPYSGTAATKDYTITTTEALSCDILVVGGGGGGGAGIGSGGGAGGLIYTNLIINAGTYNIIVGGGGSGATSGTGSDRGSNGFNSSAFGNISYGGGGGAGQSWVYYQSNTAGGTLQTTSANQGSGAGGTRYKTLGNAGTLGQGNSGGNHIESHPIYSPGGGGGAGGAGGNGSTQSSPYYGIGGIGRAISITGTSIGYAGGGGAWGSGASGGTATDGGGAGAAIGTNGTNGRGGGGGGGDNTGGKGGSGIIIIRYRKASNTVSNTLFSILSGGIITTSSNLYSNLITNYVDTPAPVSTGISSQWSSNVSKIYYNTSNVGIGTLDPVVPLHIYNTTTSRLLIDTTTTAPATLEFRRGTGVDTQNDYRFINDTDTYIKLQMENSTQSFGNTSANLAWFSSNETIIHKNTAINGRVGIGTVYHTTRSLDVLGDANISGAVSVGGLSVGGSGSGGVNAIITNSLTSNTSLIIRNEMIPPSITSSPAATTTATTGAYTYQVFTYTSETGGAGTRQTLYNITISGNAVCDILMVGGGGGGGKDIGGGGGGGAVLYGTNISIASGTYEIRVGDGAVAGETRGKSTTGFGATILGGGCAGNTSWGNNPSTANSGGSGAGGKAFWGVNSSPSTLVAGGIGVSTKGTTLTTATLYNGNVGGTAVQQYAGDPIQSAGGGGAGAVGGNGNGSGSKTGNGGAGVLVNITDVNYYWGAGGGGGSYNSSPANGGLGGGGAGYDYSYGSGTVGGSGYGAASGYNAGNGTGSGGGGSGYQNGTAGKGGSGIVIIRYLTPPTTISSSIEFIRGTAADANRDYKLGNYNSEFKVISSTSGVDTDYIKITTAGAITNPTGTASWNTGSDRRIKENIERASYDKCFDNINKLELNRFNYIEGFNTVSRDNKQLGFIAQEVYDIFPKAISSHEYNTDTLSIPNLLSIDVSQINYSLYGAVKKLIKINEEDEKELSSFDNRIKTIKTILNIAMELTTSNLLDTSSNVILDT